MRAREETAALEGEPHTTFAQALRAVLGAIRRMLPAERIVAVENRLLRRDECVRFLPHGIAALECRLGTCLVTQEGDREDHVLVGGDAFRPAPRGVVVAWSLTETELMLRVRR